MTKKVKFTLRALGVVLLISMCPIVTSVSGPTKISILREGDAPMANLQIRQSWGLYGWGGMGGKATATTDSSGSVTFPPRKNIGFLGGHLFNRAGAFVTQCSSILVFGGFGYGYTERWGPILGIDIDLPPGYWQPASWEPASEASDDIVSAHINDGSHRYIYIQNIDPLHPNAYISGDALGFAEDTEVVLRLRKATTEEDGFIRDNQSRQVRLNYMQNPK